MNDLTNIKVFIDNGKDREKEDLSNLIFKDIEYNEKNKPSFYRSDFRGSKFINMVFYKNNFEIADFISNSFKNVEFINTFFTNPEVKNCHFDKCIFDTNIYQTVSFHGCIFSKTSFKNEVFSFTMENCEFIDCSFTNCSYDQCSTENLKFIECKFLKCEMSTMHAENFMLQQCIFRDTYLGLPFLGTYLIIDTDFNLLKFKYRGEEVEVTKELWEKQIQSLYTQERYFEYLNFLILFNNPKQLLKSLSNLVEKTFLIENKKVKEYNINSIFEMFNFYFGSNRLTLGQEFVIVSILKEFDTSSLTSEEKLLYDVNIYKLEMKFDQQDTCFNHIKTLPLDWKANLQIRLNVNDEVEGKLFIDKVFNEINHKMLSNAYNNPLYEIQDIRKGSVIIELSCALLLGYSFIKFIHMANITKCRIKINNAVTDECIKHIQNSNSLNTIKNTLSLTNKQFPETNVDYKKIHTTLGTDEIISIIISKIFI